MSFSRLFSFARYPFLKFLFSRAIEIEVPIKDKLDFFGVNHYTRIHLRFNPFKKMGVELRHLDLGGYGLTDLGWEIHPSRRARKSAPVRLPPQEAAHYITENGIATHDSYEKRKYMRRHIDVLEKSLRSGLDVRGYFYWSFIDNYEWLQGLDARFGLYRVDFAILKRIPTNANAASYYSYLIQSRSAL